MATNNILTMARLKYDTYKYHVNYILKTTYNAICKRQYKSKHILTSYVLYKCSEKKVASSK